MSAALDAAILAACQDDWEPLCDWPECKCIHFSERIRSALHAFLDAVENTPPGLSYEARQTLRAHIS